MDYRLNPSRALLHPAWLGSLAVLALNDHVLKGADFLPGVVTGKLSDVAGLLVAPVLLAAVLRVRRFGPWLGCHLAVAAVFAAIQLSTTAAAGWSALMGTVGFAWAITMDPTDLLTLPILGLSLWGFLPVMRRSMRAATRRTAEAGAATAGLLCCVATSPAHPPPDDCCWEEPWDEPEPEEPWEPELEAFEADLYVHNATASEQIVRIRTLRADVEIECEALGAGPGMLLRSSMFEPATTWALPADANVAVRDMSDGSAPCYAAWIEADTLPATVAYWYDGAPGVNTIEPFGAQQWAGELVLGEDIDGLVLTAESDLLQAAQPREPEAEGLCQAQPDALRVGWSTPVPLGPARIEAIEQGIDGCLGVDLLRGEVAETWYLCIPPTSFAYQVGDEVSVSVSQWATGSDTLEVVGIDEQGAEDPSMTRLTMSAGAMAPRLAEVDILTEVVEACELSTEPSCGTVAQPLKVRVHGPDLAWTDIHAGDAPVRIPGDQRRVEVTVLHAEYRYAVDPVCALGPDEAGPDIDVVVAEIPDRT